LRAQGSQLLGVFTFSLLLPIVPHFHKLTQKLSGSESTVGFLSAWPVTVYAIICERSIDRKLEAMVQEKGDA